MKLFKLLFFIPCFLYYQEAKAEQIEISLSECGLLSSTGQTALIKKNFVQKRHIIGLTKPIQSTGELVIEFDRMGAKAKSITWNTLKPSSSTVKISKTGFVLESQSGETSEDTYKSRRFQEIAKVILSLHSPSNTSELEKKFSLRCYNNDEKKNSYILQGKPKGRAMARFLKAIEIRGGNEPEYIRLEDRRGDLSEIILQ